MPVQNRFESDDLQKCGEIMVSAKSNMFAMSCMFCQDIFTRLQSFMRHMHQAHNDKIKFHSNAQMAVYAVEELVNRTLCEVDESEESGVAEDDMRWSDFDDDEEDVVERKSMAFKSLCQRGRPKIKGDNAKDGGNGGKGAKGATLANLSILEALEDCDVSLNFVENLDTTIVEKKTAEDEELGEKLEEDKAIVGDMKAKLTRHEESDEGMDVGEDDCDMDSTLLKRIQLDLDLDNNDGDEGEIDTHSKDRQEEVSPKETTTKDHEELEDEDQNATLTEDNINETLNTSVQSKTVRLKGLLSGLEDLDDVDDLLDNIDDSIVSMPKKDDQLKIDSPQKFENTEEEDTEDVLNKSVINNNDNSTENSAEEKQDIQTPDDPEGKSQKRVSALELQLMADLDLDENDLEDCLHNSSLAIAVIPKCVESPENNENSQHDVEEPKTTKAEKDVPEDRAGKEGQCQKNNTNDIQEISDTRKLNKGTPKSRNNSRKGTQMAKTPKTAKENNNKEGHKDIPEVKVTPKSNKDDRKSRITSNKDDKRNPTTKGSVEKRRKSSANRESKVAEIKKFEEGLSEQNSSTLMYPKNTETITENENILGNSLQALLSKELGEEVEDLDLLINQLETSLGECESEMNKTVIAEEPTEESNKEEILKEAKIVETDIKDHSSDNFAAAAADDEGCSEDEMAIFNKFIGLTSEDDMETEKIEEKEEECDKEPKEAEEDLDDFENLLNEDLSKALEQALGEETKEQLHEEKEAANVSAEETAQEEEEEKQTHDQEQQLEKDIQKEVEEDDQLSEQLMHGKTDPANPSPGKASKTPTPDRSKNTESLHVNNKTTKRSITTIQEENYKGKFSKTNQKARLRQGKPLENKENDENITAEKHMQNESNIGSLPPTLIKVLPINYDKQDGFLKQTSPLKNNLLLDTKVKQERSPLKQRMAHRTPSHRIQQKTTQVSVSQIKKEKITPARCFINTERGSRTPMKLEDMFLKQSPKTLEKSEGKQSSKSLTPKTPEDNLNNKKSPSQCKINLTRANLIRTPTTTKQSPPQTTTQFTKSPTPPRGDCAEQRQEFVTPQKTRNLSVKVLRCTPSSQRHKVDKTNEIQIGSPKDFKSPPTLSPSQEATLRKNSPLSAADREFVANKFKLPKGITISKVPSATSTFPAMVEVTPSRSNYCKQNFTENSLQQQVQILGEMKQSTESLIKSVPSSITITKTEPSSLSTRLRARQASIDIVTGKNLPPPASKTPKSNLDYKSYAVIRSARKKEVLQRMRHIKKQIFKSIGTDVMGNVRTVKSPLVKKPKRSKIQIENVEILPNVKHEVLTPLLNAQNLSPSVNIAMEQSPRTSISPKRTAETPTNAPSSSPFEKLELSETLKTPTISSPSAEKGCSATKKTPPTTKSSPSAKMQCTATSKTPNSSSPSAVKGDGTAELKTPTSSSPSTKRGRGGATTLKRSATSPLLEEERPSKKSHKSPGQQKKNSETKLSSTELESTQLGLSESMVDFLQRDLRANRINVDSLLHEEMPVDDTTADETNDTVDEKEDNTKKDKENLENNGSVGKKEEEILEKKEDSNNTEEEQISEKESEKEDQKNDDNKGNTDNSADANILDDLLEQVDDEQKPHGENEDPDIKKEVKPSTEFVEDYDEASDLELLEHVGLKIIKILDIEDFHTLDEVVDMQQKAQAFANICKNFQKVFSSKQAENGETFKLLQSKVNQTFNINLLLRDIKRLVNLIVMWYSHCYNSKLIDKKSTSETTNKYLMMFHYVPKTVKRLYYCEFCEENFNTEHRYFTHRIIHTGARHPYKCKYCHVGFPRITKVKPHEALCRKRDENTNDKRELRVLKMPMCKTEEPHRTYTKPLENSQHNRPTVKTNYNCAKCDMSFSLEADVKAHMALCNRSLRRQPKMGTPRPKPKTEPYSKD